MPDTVDKNNKFLNFEGVKILVQKIKAKIEEVNNNLNIKINNKVDKDGSKVLSDNNFTDEHKTKLETQVLTEIPVASSTELGGIKVGAGLEIGTDNKLKVSDNIAAGVGAVLYNKAQTNLTEEEEAQARENIGVPAKTETVLYTTQLTITAEQKAQARTNIGAGTGNGDMLAKDWAENGVIKDSAKLGGVLAENYIQKKTLQDTKVELLGIMRGKNKAYTFDTKEAMKQAVINYLKKGIFDQAPLIPSQDDPSKMEQKLYTGDILYIREVNVPDYWWDETGVPPAEVGAAESLKAKGWVYELEATTVNPYAPLTGTEVGNAWDEGWAVQTPTV